MCSDLFTSLQGLDCESPGWQKVVLSARLSAENRPLYAAALEAQWENERLLTLADGCQLEFQSHSQSESAFAGNIAFSSKHAPQPEEPWHWEGRHFRHQEGPWLIQGTQTPSCLHAASPDLEQSRAFYQALGWWTHPNKDQLWVHPLMGRSGGLCLHSEEAPNKARRPGAVRLHFPVSNLKRWWAQLSAELTQNQPPAPSFVLLSPEGLELHLHAQT